MILQSLSRRASIRCFVARASSSQVTLDQNFCSIGKIVNRFSAGSSTLEKKTRAQIKGCGAHSPSRRERQSHGYYMPLSMYKPVQRLLRDSMLGRHPLSSFCEMARYWVPCSSHLGRSALRMTARFMHNSAGVSPEHWTYLHTVTQSSTWFTGSWLICVQAHRFNAGYADAISPSLIDGLSSFSKNGWSSVKSEAIPPEHPKRPGLSSTALIVSHLHLSILWTFSEGVCWLAPWQVGS